jgi:hypothetical protein
MKCIFLIVGFSCRFCQNYIRFVSSYSQMIRLLLFCYIHTLQHRQGMGLSTGLDLDQLVTVGDWICRRLSNRANGSKVARAMLAQRRGQDN